jgi:lysophospholipase L1-like esterase
MKWRKWLLGLTNIFPPKTLIQWYFIAEGPHAVRGPRARGFKTMACRGLADRGPASFVVTAQLAVRLSAALVLGVVPTTAAVAQGAPQPACVAPADLVRLDIPLKRTGQRIAGSLPLTVVAIGSSSTSGAGATSPANSYPSRLAVELQARFQRASIIVHNRGVGGETAREMLARFDRDVFAVNPDLVIWQAGSNSVLRDQPLDRAGTLLRDGLIRLKAAGVDVVLMNPQYAPKVITKDDADEMVDLIDLTAKQAHVALFQRFAVMRYWRLTEEIPFSAFLSPDELHMNDWSYGCVAKLLAAAIADAATRATVTATATPPRR